MDMQWKIDAADIRRVKSFFKDHQRCDFVRERMKKNVRGIGRGRTISKFWRGLVVALVTTQQRSGPGSAVRTFLRSTPFPLSYRRCRAAGDLWKTVRRELTDHGGIRRADTIANQLCAAMKLIEAGEKKAIMACLKDLPSRRGMEAEREAANYLAETFPGLGPKQSRNLLQYLGLTRYEIPIDSRLTKWLNEFGFPVQLSAAALADSSYYEVVLDGVQALCKAAKIYPCVLDAAIFASFDRRLVIK